MFSKAELGTATVLTSFFRTHCRPPDHRLGMRRAIKRLTPVPDLWQSLRINRRKDTPMTKKLTISIDDRVYDGLHAIIGRGNIGKFLEDLARPFVVTEGLAAAYAEMSADQARDAEAEEWCESLAGDGSDATW